MLEPAAPGWPCVERTRRTGLPDGDLVALAELGRRVAVQPEHLRQRRRRVRAHGGVPRRRRRDLRDGSHPDGVMVTPGQECLASRRAQGGGVESGVRQPALGQSLGRRGQARTAEGAGGAETHVIQEDDEDVGGALRRPQRLDGLVASSRVLGIVEDRTVVHPVGNREDCSIVHASAFGHGRPLLEDAMQCRREHMLTPGGARAVLDRWAPTQGGVSGGRAKMPGSRW